MEYFFKDTKVFYKILGEGSNLVIFLHGWGASNNLMMPVYERLSLFDDNSKYLFIDFPPFGKSSEPTEFWNLDDYVNLIEEIIKQIGNFEKISIIGHSFGCRVGIKLSSRKKIDKLILFAPAGIKPRFSFRKIINIWRYKFYKKIKSSKIKNFGSKDYKVLSPIMKKTFINIVNEDLTKICHEIVSPTLIIAGKKDKETPYYMSKKINKAIKESKLITLQNGNHFGYIYYLSVIFPAIHSFLN